MSLGSGIRNKPIPDPRSRGKKGTPGSQIRILNTGYRSIFRHRILYGTIVDMNDARIMVHTDPQRLKVRLTEVGTCSYNVETEICKASVW